MTRPWQEKVVAHHINGSPYDNRPENLCFMHSDSRQPLDDLEIHEYHEYLLRRRVERGR